MLEQESVPHSVQRYAMVLRRQWWVALVVTVVALAASVFYVERATPVYSASMKVVVGQGETLFAPGLAVNMQSYTQTITDLLQSQVVARRTIDTLGMRISPQTLLSNLSVSAGPSTSVIDVSYDDTDRSRAARVLGTLGGIFTELVNKALAGRTGTSASQSSQPVSVVVFDPAHADPGRVSPRTARTVGIAGALGLIAGLLLALLRDALSGRIRSEEEAEAAYGAPVIGSLPRDTLGLPVGGAARLPAKVAARLADTFQMLTARLRYSADLERGVIVVAGARPEDGKSTVSAHIAAALARSGNEVIALEADLHRPALCRLLGVHPGHAGLREVIAHERELEALLVEVDGDERPADGLVTEPEPAVMTAATGPGVRPSRGPAHIAADGRPTGRVRGRLRLLAAGVNGEKSAALSLAGASPLISHLRERSDYVVIDTPPLLLSGDAYPLLQLADAVIVVTRERASSHEDARRTRKILRSLGVQEFSLVVSESASVTGEDYYASADGR